MGQFQMNGGCSLFSNTRSNQEKTSRAGRWPVALPAALVAAAALAGCGGAASQAPKSTAPAAPSAAAQPAAAVSPATLAHLQALVAQAEATPTFVPPGPPVDAAKARGDKVEIIPGNSEISYCADEANDLVKLGQSLGIPTSNYATTGRPSQWVQGVLQGFATHVNAIDLSCGITPAALGPQLQVAKQNHVATILAEWYLPNQPVPSAVTGATGTFQDQAEQLLVDDAIVQNHGKPFHALILTADDAIAGPGAAEAALQEFQKRCGQACPAQIINIPLSEWGTRIQSTVSSALTADPKVTAIIAVFDGMVPGALPAMEAAHRPGLKIYSYGAGAGVVRLIQTTHGMVAADIGPSANWAAYALMDEDLRVMTGQKPLPPNKEYPALRMWTPANVSQYFTPDGYGTSYITGYDKLWGIHS
ncbi:MAG: hypothetical protein K6U14_00265 [Firmicutes bacterium]|nr:sugar ABC transporter substrate-binding protein [Alicyclobacillaceae bacterium]MCL6496054.1 hypothetical protein [Bacillota bacterium]